MGCRENDSVKAIRPARVNPLLLHPQECRMSLDGQWRFRLDPEDRGVKEGWFRSVDHLPESLQVPGSWQGQGFGSDKAEMVQDFRFPARTYRASYKGTGWYGRCFRVPDGWTGKRLWLNFGGAHPSAEVWLNGIRLGENSLPFVPFAFEVGDIVHTDGENRLLVRVHEKNRIFGSTYNWQGNWSGLYRGVELSAVGPCWLERCALLPDVDSGHLVLRVEAGGQAGGSAEVLLCAGPVNGSRPAVSGRWRMDGTSGEFRLPVPQPLLWSPDHPELYRADIELRCAGEICDARSERTGFVKLEARGKEFCINGEPYYMRGTGDFVSCPETGCPDTDRERWRRKLQVLRDYGYNHVRCQSFVYGPEYYDAADEVGLLVQSEMGMLGGWGGASVDHAYQWPKPTPDNYPILKEQWDLVVERDASHPSANLYCMSNEYWANVDFPRIAWECYHQTKRLKPTSMVIWTDGGWNEDLPGDFVNHFVHTTPGLKPEELEAMQKPVIQHEYAWWSSFPDVRCMEKFSGAIRPYAAEIAVETAFRRGQGHLLEAYAVNSQHLQLIEAKAKMELIRRDYPTLAGISHFNAMDAGPSPQGIIDEFYERKLASAPEWLQTNGDTVIMSSLGFNDRCLESGSRLEVLFSVSDFSHPPFHDPRLAWRLAAGEDTLAAGEMRFEHQPFVTVAAGRAAIVVPAVERPLEARLEARLVEGDGGREIGNCWSLWLFPPSSEPPQAAVCGEPRWTWLARWTELPRREVFTAPGEALLLTEALDEDLLAFMDGGGRVMLVAGEGLVRPHGPMMSGCRYFFTPPANYPTYEDGQNGTVVADHPMLDGLPHQGFADWQLFRVIDQAPPLDLESLGLTDSDPVIRLIHRYRVLHPLGYLLERRAGKGSLIICALELDPAWTEARWLLRRMAEYALSESCQPDQELTAATVARLLDAGRILKG